MATLSQNITRAIQDLNDIRDAIISTGVGMPENENVDNYASWIAMMKPDLKLEVSISSGTIPPEGGSVTITITSNTDWEITYVGTFTFSATSGRGNATVTVSAPMNHDTDRIVLGNVHCVQDTSIMHEFGISQDKFVETLSVSPTSITFKNIIGITEEITVTSNTTWNAIPSGPFSISPSRNEGNGKITVTTLGANDADGSVTITTQYDNLEKVVTITQRQ